MEQLDVHGIRQKPACDFATQNCVCAPGFIERDSMCLDINECAEFDDICGVSHCFNLPGSYDCRKSSLENVLGVSTVKSNGRPVFLGKKLTI